MIRVVKALTAHEFLERARDRWVLVVSALFALMAMGVTLYGRAAEETAAMLTGPSLVTLASLLVPLVALVLGHDCICGDRERNTLGLLLSLPASPTAIVLAKLAGRLLALTLSIGLGLGAALLLSDPAGRLTLLTLIGPTLLLGASFLAIGAFLSVIATRPSASASFAVVVWFVLVLFYDMGLLGLLVFTDGAVPASLVNGLVVSNPVGLYRVELMGQFSGASGFEDLVRGALPGGGWVSSLIWLAWILGLSAITSLTLTRRRSHR